MQDRARVMASLGSVAWLVVGCSTDSPSVVDGSSSETDGASMEDTSSDGASLDDTSSGGTSSGGTSSGGTSSDGTSSDGTSSDGTSSDGTSSGSSSGGADSEGTGTTSDTSTSGDPVCGNGIVEAGEACDDTGESPACNVDCTPALCGDELVNASAGETCDGADLGSGTCETAGFGGGTLACSVECGYDTSGCANPPAAPVLQLAISPIKRFDLGWAAVPDASHYELLERAWPGEPYVQLGGPIVGESLSLDAPLHLRHEASYVLRACNVGGCSESAEIAVAGSLAEAVGYVKASNTGVGDLFGWSIALSADGSTLAIAASNEDSNATGIDGDQANGSASNAGAVYVLVRDAMGAWTQQAYVKASNPGAGDIFGNSVALSADGSTLAIGAHQEDGGSAGIGGDQASNASPESGAVYVLVRDGAGTWTQQAYVKASNTDSGDGFGSSVALSADGSTLAVGAEYEDSFATGIGGDQANDALSNAGATYVFVRDGGGAWSQQGYIKASNPSPDDRFGGRVGLSADGDTLAVGAWRESSSATGIDGDQANEAANASGAAYVFVRDVLGSWSQQAYIKASNTSANDWFGLSLDLSADGDTLAVGAIYEDSSASGIGGDQADESGFNAGAAYVYERNVIGQWTQVAYVKATNPDLHDNFGWDVALSGDGDVLAVGAWNEDGSAGGIGGDQADDSMSVAGGAYVLVRDGAGTWAHRSYVKASNPGVNDEFGRSLALSGDGRTLALGSWQEDGNATGVGGNQANDLAVNSGAVYLY